MEILVLGGGGMLGHKMFQQLRQCFPGTHCAIRGYIRGERIRHIELFQQGQVIEGFEGTDFGVVQQVLLKMRPRVLVNCIGVIKHRAQGMSPIPSITVNSLFPHKLAQLADHWGGRVIHFSTDCVFSGKRGGYLESDLSDAEDLYGRTKFLGELAEPNTLTLRTSIIGRELAEHRSLLDWFLAQHKKTIRGFRRVIYSGVTTNHLAELVALIIEKHSKLSGLYQVASQPIAKYDLLCLLRDAYGVDVQIEPDDLEISDRSMKSDKLRQAINYDCPPWPILVRQLVEDKSPYKQWLEGQ